MQQGDPRAIAGAAATNAIRRENRRNRRGIVAALLDDRPTMSTDAIADLLHVNRSTVRRDRAWLRQEKP